MRILGGCLAVALGLMACGGGTGADSPLKTAAQTPARVDPGPYSDLLGAPQHDINDAARFLAGLPGLEGSPFLELEKEEAWKSHATRIGEIWDRNEQARVGKMRQFHKAALSGPAFDGRTVFYPFGGPDILTALSFFPEHKLYVLAALEPPGTLPRPEDFSAAELGKQLAGLDGTLASLLGRSFFITREMDKQLRGQVTDGVLPVMLVQLARMNQTILRWSSVKLDDQGKLVARTGSEPRAAFGRNRAMLLEFKGEKEAETHEMLYVSLNLDDKHMADNQAFKAFVSSLGPVASMLKSTSYMMHRKDFSIIRELVLDSSVSIVQDDSGVPFHAFDLAKWQLDLYGSYDKPYTPFGYMQQKDLQSAYSGDGIKPLDFRIGYGAGKIPSNLQVARKKS
jgi:hypothetical protein